MNEPMNESMNQSINKSINPYFHQAAAHMVRQRMINNAEVLCATCVGAGGGMLERCVFERVLVDEAGQATELATVVALSRGCKQLALVVRSSKTLSLNQSTFSSKMASHICAVRLID